MQGWWCWHECDWQGRVRALLGGGAAHCLGQFASHIPQLCESTASQAMQERQPLPPT